MPWLLSVFITFITIVKWRIKFSFNIIRSFLRNILYQVSIEVAWPAYMLLFPVFLEFIPVSLKDLLLFKVDVFPHVKYLLIILRVYLVLIYSFLDLSKTNSVLIFVGQFCVIELILLYLRYSILTLNVIHIFEF